MAYGIEVERLVRAFKDVRAVDGIDLVVAEGEIYGFLGPNGAGKSTTVHMLTTLLPPTDGRARVAGFDVVKEGPKVRAAIGAALQEAALDPLLTGREHLRLQTALHGSPATERQPRATELLERVGLDGRRRPQGAHVLGRHEAPPRPRARPRPPPAHPLPRRADHRPRSRSRARRSGPEVGRLAHEDGVTVFLTTQYLEEADVLADRVGIIDHGRIVAEGTPAELKAEIGHPTVEVVPADPEQRAGARAHPRAVRRAHADVAEVARRAADRRRLRPRRRRRALDAEELHVEHLQLHAPSLDDVFLAKTGRTLEGAGAEQPESSSSE